MVSLRMAHSCLRGRNRVHPADVIPGSWHLWTPKGALDRIVFIDVTGREGVFAVNHIIEVADALMILEGRGTHEVRRSRRNLEVPEPGICSCRRAA